MTSLVAYAIGCQKRYFFHKLMLFRSAEKWGNDTFFNPPSPLPCHVCKFMQQWWHLYWFAILGSTLISILRNWPRRGSCNLLGLLAWKIMKTSFAELPKRMPQKVFFPCTCNFLVSWKTMQRHFFPDSITFPLHAKATTVAFILLCNSRFDFHCYNYIYIQYTMWTNSIPTDKAIWFSCSNKSRNLY